MTVVSTDLWLETLYENPVEICKKFQSSFQNASAEDIYQHLRLHGMYRPVRNGLNTIKKMKEKNVWSIVEKEERLLRRRWSGPLVQIYIFPSDSLNRNLIKDYNGKSGLAYKDKLFLFFSKDNSEEEIKAVTTHEYNHVCRLQKYQKREESYTLLDTIILEGLAENSVRERFGENNVANWTKYYSEDQLEGYIDRVIKPNSKLSHNNSKHQDILYGLKLYPKMVGYCCGYFLVKKYMLENQCLIKDILSLDSREIAKID